MSWYHLAMFNMDRRPSRLIASCKRFSRRLSTGIFRVVRRIQVPGRSFDFPFFCLILLHIIDHIEVCFALLIKNK